jgi:hypothetical protein
MAKVDTILRWLDSFTSKGQINIGDLSHSRRLVVCNLTLALATALLACWIILCGPYNPLVNVSCFICPFVFGLNPLLLKRLKHKNAVSIIGSLASFEVVVMNGMLSSGLGGFRAIAVTNVPMLPLICFFMGGLIPGYIATTLAVVEIVFFYLVEKFTATPLDMETWREIHNRRMQTQLMCWLLFTIIGAIIGWTYEITFVKSQKVLQRSLSQVNALSQQLFYKNVTRTMEKNPSNDKTDE